ncbi:ATP-dependent DNA helicase RecQ [Aquimarina sp. MAR_2010_214]|uniref:DNA helicase RecQ n=1 Tax=Aquimarina sp. MAR_2010_214 TaxID=1250026 RepID=UPI000C702B3F|nr:DNA helicase RecQ [Aquimarina sp. MAR_2010_214]PKV51022.1 ATP-dependent DNA helicase RecQ [Aquimarina sp. MAR_2010_214]
MPDQQLISHTLKEYFGYDSFRPLQQDIIASVFAGDDNLVIMPTGGGKSICYQLPALLLPGVTLVISPLIALMKDQVDGLLANGIKAAFINSSQTETEQQEIYQKLSDKEIKLLYIAPESLSFLEVIFSQIEISLIAIDEAHCISAWGHDFRPAYTQLGYLKNRFPKTPVIALTATADKATRQDICDQLNISNAKRYLASFDRKNLSLEVRPGNKRIEQIIDFLKDKPNDSGIIYCLSRKTTEMLSEKLQNQGFNAQAYHAGVDHQKRSSVQEGFINDTVQIVCATIAFGMGIDKSNVRWVIHYNLPKNIEGYYQEIGRAGRDSLPSFTLLFHSYADVVQLQKFANMSGNQEVQLAKLDRMKQYADSLSCRRKILLSYFGELIEEDCGNCDVCKNPPTFIDGTIIAQKALSTVTRTKEQEPIGTVIDILRGAQNTAVYDKEYQNIKTYGIGSDMPWRDWQQYIIQLINQGYLEIAFHQNNKLKLTTLSRKVLFEGEKVSLAHLQEFEKAKQAAAINQVDQGAAPNLFEKLRQLRLELAKEAGIPAYQIFSDATLKEMEKFRPISDEEFMQINGVGRQKMQNYGYQFIKAIIDFSAEKTKKKKKKSTKKGNTHLETLTLYQQGLSIEEIALQRQLAQSTIFSHIMKLYENGESIDLKHFVSKEDLNTVKNAKKELDNPETLKPYFEHFEGAIDYNTIKLVLTILEEKSSES